MRILFAGLQKEWLRLSYLLSLADENFRLPANVMVPLLFPGLFLGDVLSGIYFVFEANFFMRSICTWDVRYFSSVESTLGRRS